MRAKELVDQMTLDEKITLLHGVPGPNVGNVAGIERLGIPPQFFSDGPQGYRTDRHLGNGTSTAFPSALNIAATFDPTAAYLWGDTMGKEFRAKGATMQLGPGMNVARIPRNGRNFEYMSGEDPILGRELVQPTIKGIQQNKVMANAKHYINNNAETNRENVSAWVDERTTWQIYQQPFIGAVRAGVSSFMCSYNRINGTWACENEVALNQLKKEMGYDGFIMSDWAACHSTVASANAGLDMEMPGDDYFGAKLAQAVNSGEVSMQTVDDKVMRILTAYIASGAFDDPPVQKDINYNVTSDEHNRIARDLAERSLVLLKNDKNLLPLDPTRLPRGIAVLGSAARDSPIVAGLGSGHVEPPYIITGADAIEARMSAAAGATNTAGPVVYMPTSAVDEAVAAAKAADVAVVFVATTSSESYDRTNLSLPYDEDQLVSAVAAVQPNTIVVVTTPGAILMPWSAEVAGVVMAFLPGQEAGNAIASLLFGDIAPSGRLPLTMPNVENEMEMTVEQYPGIPELEPLNSHYTEGRLVGYRWYNAKNVKPLYCFGHGLSYTTFQYSNLSVKKSWSGSVQVSVKVTNTGKMTASEVVQAYVTYPETAEEPPRQLKAFGHARDLKPGQSTMLALTVAPEDLSIWDVVLHGWRAFPGEEYTVEVGRSSCDIALTTTFKL
jgi:beta-glucosidase